MARHRKSLHGSYNTISNVGQKRSKHAYVHEVKPHPYTTSRESSPAFERRVKHGSYVEEVARNRRKKMMFTVIVVAIIALIIALGVGVYTFFKTSDSNLTLMDDDLTGRLVTVSDSEPQYILCHADLSDSINVANHSNSDAYVLARVNLEEPSISYMAIPTFLPLAFDDENLTLEEAKNSKSQGQILSAIAKFCNIKISHYITTDAEYISQGVNELDGIDITMNQEIDDPAAGVSVLNVGDTTLDGSNALTYLRATNLQGGFETTAHNRMDFIDSLFSKMVSNKGLSLANFVSNAGNLISTDLTTSQILSYGDIFSSVDDIKISKFVVPYTSNGSALNSNVTYSLDSTKWNVLLQNFCSGNTPSSKDSPETVVVPSEISVEVRNGTSIDGAASRLASMLREIGYVITGTGNVEDQITYPETLVVYTDPAYADAAKAIVLEMGIGRVVNGGDFYTSEADIIAIIGADWSS